MGCLCSLLKALTSSSPSAAQNLNLIQLQKKHILREEERKRQEKNGEKTRKKKYEENVIEQNRISGKRMKEHVRPFEGKRKPNSNMIRSSSQITSSSSSPPSKDEEEEIYKKEENERKSERKNDEKHGREKEENERRGKEENDEKINRKRDEFLTGSKVHSSNSSSYRMRSKHTNEGEKCDESSSSMSMRTSSESNFVDHNFPDRPTFVHRAPSLRHTSKSCSKSKSISSSVDCISSDSFPSSSPSNPMIDSSLIQTADHSSDPSLVHSHHVSSNSPKISINKRVTFCDHHEQIE